MEGIECPASPFIVSELFVEYLMVLGRGYQIIWPEQYDREEAHPQWPVLAQVSLELNRTFYTNPVPAEYDA